MELRSIQVGLPKTIPPAESADAEKEWTTGFFKTAVSGPVWLGLINLAGDGQGDLRNHGGRDKAVNLYPAEHFPYWEAELGIGPLIGGAFGENFTTTGLLESDVCVGDIFAIGSAHIQISQPRQPCWKLARRWAIPNLALRVQETGRTGWYFRVLREGEVVAGTSFVLLERPYPAWTVAAANAVMHQRKDDIRAAAELADCPALSGSWRETLRKRVATGQAASTAARLEGPGRS